MRPPSWWPEDKDWSRSMLAKDRRTFSSNSIDSSLTLIVSWSSSFSSVPRRFPYHDCRRFWEMYICHFQNWIGATVMVRFNFLETTFDPIRSSREQRSTRMCCWSDSNPREDSSSHWETRWDNIFPCRHPDRCLEETELHLFADRRSEGFTFIDRWGNTAFHPRRLIIEQIDRQIRMPMRLNFHDLLFGFLQRERNIDRKVSTIVYLLIFDLLFGGAREEILGLLVDLSFVFVQSFALREGILRRMRWLSAWIDGITFASDDNMKIDRTIVLDVLQTQIDDPGHRSLSNDSYFWNRKLHKSRLNSIRRPISVGQIIQCPNGHVPLVEPIDLFFVDKDVNILGKEDPSIEQRSRARPYQRITSWIEISRCID